MMKLVQKQNPDLWSRLSKTYGHKGCKYKMRPALDRNECCKNFERGSTKTILKATSKLYIPSTLNIDLILWHTQLIVYAVKC
jgi:hypothetical protein